MPGYQVVSTELSGLFLASVPFPHLHVVLAQLTLQFSLTRIHKTNKYFIIYLYLYIHICIFKILFIYFFATISPYLAQAGLEFVILLLQSLECWDYKHVPHNLQRLILNDM
jgi:hypothetical protein